MELWDELLSLTESDPDFRFLMDGQTVVIDDYLEIRPEAEPRLQAAIRRGQIQVGPWYTLPDEFLVSGETLIRDLQRGLEAGDASGGSMRVGYLPDSFGHAAQMPQLYRQLGFRYAAVWRGVPLAIDRVAFDWEAPDGSQILTAYMGNSYAHGVDLPTEPGDLAARIRAALQAIEPFRPTSDVLLMNGNDHVLPQRALSRAVRQASEHIDGTRIRLARLDEYLDTLPESGWPRWRGELRSSARANVLMGTLSVRVPDKQLYADATRRLERLAEPSAALASVDAADRLDTAWSLILQNAAHDTACGSGIDAVAEESRQRSKAAAAMAQQIFDQALPRLAGAGQVWNPSPFPRQGLVEMQGRAVLTPLIGGCSVASLEPTSPELPAHATSNRLENGRIRCELNADGTFTVTDLNHGISFPGMNRLVDEADAGDEYNFSPPENNPTVAEPIAGLHSRVLEAGPLRARLEASFEYRVFSGLRPDRQSRTDAVVALPVRLTLTLEAGRPRLDIALEIDNRARDHRLRTHFPIPFSVTESAADTPFHVTRRPVVTARRDPGAPEVELPTYPMWSFVDVSDGRQGLALIADGLHEYEVVAGERQELALTLLRAVGWLSRDDLSLRTGHAGPAMETPGAQVSGVHHFQYSLLFHAGDWQQAAVWRNAEMALLPLVAGRGPAAAAGPPPVLELDPDCVQMTACIPRRDGFELRLLNASDSAQQAKLVCMPAAAELSRLTLGGATLDPIGLDRGVGRLDLRAWEITTIRVRR